MRPHHLQAFWEAAQSPSEEQRSRRGWEQGEAREMPGIGEIYEMVEGEQEGGTSNQQSSS